MLSRLLSNSSNRNSAGQAKVSVLMTDLLAGIVFFTQASTAGEPSSQYPDCRVKSILAPGEQEFTSGLPAWAPENEYYELTYETIKITKERYEALRQQKLPMFRHPTHYEQWQRVIFDPSNKQAVAILDGGV
jgi:hypothetical protein